MGITARLSDMAEVTIQGDNAESVINACIRAGIPVGKIERTDEITVKLSIQEKETEKLRALCERNMCELAENRPSELYRAVKTAARRANLAVIAVVFAGALFASSLFLWRIDIEGNDKLSDGEILRAISKCGVDIGAYWPGIKADRVRASAMRLLPDAAWLTVNVSGSRARVIILERTPVPEIYDEYAPADMTAKTDGVITKMTVLNGYSDLAEGSTVAAGETLIEGSVGSISGEVRKMRAKGEVWADTVRKVTAVCPEHEKCKNGTMHTSISLKTGKRIINISAYSGKSIDGCDKITKEYKMGIEDLFSLPVSLIVTKRNGRNLPENVSAQTDGAKLRLLEYLSEIIDGEIKSYEFSMNTENGLVYITLTAMCNENIAVLKG